MSDQFSKELDQVHSGELIDLEIRMKENFDKLSRSPNSWGFKMFQVLIDDHDEFKRLEDSPSILSILSECDDRERQDMVECLKELKKIYRKY